MEDATHALLQDFVDSLSNLPSEVGHLLCEIAYLDYAKKPAKDDLPPVSQAGNGESGSNKKWYSVDESRRKAASKQSSIVRHSHKPPNNLLTPSPKEPVLIERALAHYEDAIKLSQEKEKFAARAVGLVSRHLERLTHELARLEATTGTEIPEFRRDNSEVPNPEAGTPLEGSRHQKRKLASTDGVSSLNNKSAPSSASALTQATPAATKRRLTNSRQTLRLSSAPKESSYGASNVAPSAQRGEEGADEGEESNAGDDTTLYCFCQRVSYGEMIGCDNKTCQYEWFHVPCLGLKETPMGNWYCPQCTAEGKGEKFLHSGRQRKRH